ncbi:hypothetical protein GGR56DRAFT_675068 [Xylariaceae sp. FL0804]|nr:hypothetical protein GGR56DRAFT_675068 [Xylariaceae sp. FL0804]
MAAVCHGACHQQCRFESLVGEVLDRRFELGHITHQENHAVVFSVTPLTHGNLGAKDQPDESCGFEVRAYDLEGLDPKYRQYRLRNMKRLAARSVLRTTIHGIEVVVIKTGSLKEPKAKSAKQSESMTTRPNGGKYKAPKPKTSYRRESDRCRQHDRRAAKRQRERVILSTSDDQEPAGSDGAMYNMDDGTFRMLVVLFVAFDSPPELRERLPESFRFVVEQFLARRQFRPDFASEDDTEDFIDLKEANLPDPNTVEIVEAPALPALSAFDTPVMITT